LEVTGVIYNNLAGLTFGRNTVLVPSIDSAAIYGMRYYNNSVYSVLDSYSNGRSDRIQTSGIVRDEVDTIQVNFGHDFGDRFGRGMMAEQILFTTRLYNVHTLLVQNYLSSKYGVSCDSIDRYTQDDLYYHEVAGIGQFSEYDKHLDAQGPGIVRMNNALHMDDSEFLLWGHNNGDLEWFWGDPIFSSGRLARIWGYEKTGDCGFVTVSIEDAPYMNEIENIGIIWDEVPNLESSNAPKFTPLILNDNVWVAEINFSGKGIFTIGGEPIQNQVDTPFRLFPNPASDEVTIHIDELTNAERLEILNALGQVVISRNLNEPLITLDVSGLNSGNYFARILEGQKVIHTEKLEVINN
jgi:hypothetical protein